MSVKRNIATKEITRFIAGECTPDESRVISGLIGSDPVYKSVFEAYNQVWNHTTPGFSAARFDVDSAWIKVESRIAKEPSVRIHQLKRITSPIHRFANYALKAAAVLLIGLAIYQLLIPHTSYQLVSSGSTISAPVTLADGSKISLNSSSSIKFPEKFGGNSREVYFWGEAFFEVAHDPARPFIIETGDARIKVLGTSFNVKAYPETDKIEVVVNSGKVLFYHVDKSGNILGDVILQKGEKGVYYKKSGLITRLLNDEPNFLSWKTGVLIFNETSLDKVLDVVSHRYGVTFTLADKNLAKLKLTATFDNESLDAVLEVLHLVHNLQFVNNGKDYLVKK